MMRLLSLLPLLFLVACQESSRLTASPEVGEAQSVRIGKESRFEVTSSEKLVRSVGQLRAYYSGDYVSSCTGTLIGPNLVLTAAHCVHSTKNGGWPERILFYPDLYKGKEGRQDIYLVDQIYYLSDYFKFLLPNGRTTTDQIPFDIAVVSLAKLGEQKPAGEVYGWLPVGIGGAGGRASMVSYPGDKPDGTKWMEEGCQLMEFTDDVYSIECDAFSGASGSAVLVNQSGSTSIRGVFSADNMDQERNFAARLTPKISKAINSLVTSSYQNLFVKRASGGSLTSAITVHNECDQDLLVAVSYKDVQNIQKTVGFYLFKAKEKSLLARISGYEYFIYARGKDGKIEFSGNDAELSVNGQGPFGFSKMSLSGPQDTVLALSCDRLF